MAFAYTTTGATDESSVVRGNVALVSGTWAGSAGSGTIDTGLSTVLGYGVEISTVDGGTGGTASFKVKANVTGNETASAGKIGILNLDNVNTKGDWWAICKLS